MNRPGTALVTGSSHNLGLAIATRLAADGNRVVIHGPDRAAAEAAATRLRAEVPGATVHSTGFDLADPEAIEAGFATLAGRGLAPTILVNNAAHLGLGPDDVLDETPRFFRDVFEVNLFAVHLCSMLAARHMAQAGGGAIVNISSLASERAIPGRTAYNASKAAVDGLTRSLAVDLAPHGIRVNAIAPGFVWSTRWDHISDDEAAARRQRIPAGEPTAQQEIAHLVAFLASERTPTLTGARIVIDGGLNALQVPPDRRASPAPDRAAVTFG
ncbi:SDR family NAD(P)-dependent oxidoreductase [Phytohabitans suffuscus]|uniref:3-oxoacyl-ACP reductase n=1 Tax=Phytohabitans suffuscus TaxID=624315 RepID=A0A6F8YAX8_9ACTN|nr:SDR family oxidoreductase [Phytohabitans suffuscus]BCB83272.1 3-oxoacyl-ACP reductase [Phytohabitans suffuscus]